MLSRSWVAVVLGLVAACTGTSSPAAPCNALCDRREECDRRLDDDEVDECVRVCNEERAFGRLRVEAESLIGRCLGGRSCKSILARDAMKACIAGARQSDLEPTMAAGRLCEALVPEWRRCGAVFPHQDCVGVVKIYDDATIEDARRCLGRSCPELQDCITSVMTF